MQIKQFRFAADNLGYVLHTNRCAIAIDGGAVQNIFSYLQKNALELVFVTHTHSHPDHTIGTRQLAEKTGASFLSYDAIRENPVINLDKEKITTFLTPGHTLDSVSFQSGRYLITGDTLFNGKAGKCFSGDLNSFYKSIKMIMSFPENTMIYAGHDYVEEYMETAQILEPDNADIKFFLRKYNPDHVCSTLKEEKKINPCLRFNNASIRSIIKKKGLPHQTEFDRWKSVMQLVQAY